MSTRIPTGASVRWQGETWTVAELCRDEDFPELGREYLLSRGGVLRRVTQRTVEDENPEAVQ